MCAVHVVILAKFFQLSFQIADIPEERMVKEFSLNGPDQSFYKGMRLRCIWDCLYFVYTQYPQICLPLVIQE